jgi:hypothetical protein
MKMIPSKNEMIGMLKLIQDKDRGEEKLSPLCGEYVYLLY